MDRSDPCPLPRFVSLQPLLSDCRADRQQLFSVAGTRGSRVSDSQTASLSCCRLETCSSPLPLPLPLQLHLPSPNQYLRFSVALIVSPLRRISTGRSFAESMNTSMVRLRTTARPSI